MLNISIVLKANGKRYELPLSDSEWAEIRSVLGVDEDEYVEYDEFIVYAECGGSSLFYETLQDIEEIQKSTKDVDSELLAAILDSGVEIDHKPGASKLEDAIRAAKDGQFYFDKVSPEQYAKERYEIANDVPGGCEEEFAAYNGDYKKMFEDQYARECVIVNDGVLYGPALLESL